MIDTKNMPTDTKTPAATVADTSAKTVTPAVGAQKEEVKVKTEAK